MDHLAPNIFGEKKKEEPPLLPEVRPWDGHVEHVYEISGSLSKNGVGILVLCVVRVRYVVFFK